MKCGGEVKNPGRKGSSFMLTVVKGVINEKKKQTEAKPILRKKSAIQLNQEYYKRMKKVNTKTLTKTLFP